VPKYVSFRTGGVIIAVLALRIMPWKIYASPVAVNLFIGVGALMGSLFGVIIANYYLIRKPQVQDLHHDNPGGRYSYGRGTNLNTLIAAVPASVITLVIALVPALSTVAPFSWPPGTSLGVIFCIAVNWLGPNVHLRAIDLAAQARELRARRPDLRARGERRRHRPAVGGPRRGREDGPCVTRDLPATVNGGRSRTTRHPDRADGRRAALLRSPLN